MTVSDADAIRAYTVNNAHAALERTVRGSIEPGKLADLTVFDRNLLALPAREILEAEVQATIVDGCVVFEKK